MDDLAIEVRGLRRSFGATVALHDIGMTVRPGEMVALLGASGSGKSTLMRQLGGLQCADRGSLSSVRLLGRSVQQAGQLARDVRRTRSQVAMIFQQFNLVERLPVITNVLAGALHRVPLWRGLLGRFPPAEMERALQALSRVGIEQCAWQRAGTLSGGQQQRAAISRALVQGAKIILADEPIASLDPQSSQRVMALLQQVNQTLGVTVLVSLHQIDYAFAYCPRTIALRAGQVVFDGTTRSLTPQRLETLYGAQCEELGPYTASHPPTPLMSGRPALSVA